MDDLEIEILVLEAQMGSRSAVQKLYEHFNQSLKKYVYVRVKNRMIAEDIAQNVWLKVYRRINRLNNVALFKSWLFKALIWELNDWYRKSNREILLPDPQNEHVYETDGSKDFDLFPLLQQLDSSERETAELYYVNDLSVREVSLVLGVPEGTIMSRLHRARATLKAVIEKNERK
ncbi:RNA polymerase sigma factor [Alteromonas sp. A081]|uniref:RNA polymerase sigma factor n=1 Tax=Alteromonas sp. A081 TaxID=3410269 RepID=UPI003B97DA40